MGKESPHRGGGRGEFRPQFVHAAHRGDQSVLPHETGVLDVRPPERHQVDESDEPQDDESRDVERLSSGGG